MSQEWTLELNSAVRSDRSVGVKLVKKCQRQVPLWLIFLVWSGQCIYAQSHGYGFAGAALGDRALQGAVRYGLGGGLVVAPHVTIGCEVGGLQKDGAGVIISGNAGVHLRRRVDIGFDPFLTGGITGVRIGGETGVYANVGGGFNYWFLSRVGLRGEVRGYPGGKDLNSFLDFRIGVSFR